MLLFQSVNVSVDDLTLALRVALAEVTDEDVEDVLLTVNFDFSLFDLLEAWHHNIASAKDVDFSFDHLSTDTASFTRGQMTIVTFLEINADLPWCSYTIKNGVIHRLQPSENPAPAPQRGHR